jgi:predicted Fe-Mo cluster-binding NifX family protein
MRIAVTSTGTGLDDQVDPRFGRCAHFVIVETDDMSCEAVANNPSTAGGAGIQAAQAVADRNAAVVLTGNCGPNAFRTLEAADIAVVTGAAGTLQDAIVAFRAGKLTATDSPNVGSHTEATT